MTVTREQLEAFRAYVADAPPRHGACRGRWFTVSERELCDLALAHLDAGWQPIETAPTETSVLITRPFAGEGSTVEIGRKDEDGNWFAGQYLGGRCAPYAWMPIPSPALRKEQTR